MTRAIDTFLARLARETAMVNGIGRAVGIAVLLVDLVGCKSHLDLGHDPRGIAPVEGPVLVTQKGPTTTVALHLISYTALDGVLLSCTDNPGAGVTVSCGMADGSASDGTLTLHADPSAQPGDYDVVVTAAVSPSSENLAPVVSLTVPFTVAVGVVVSPQVDTTLRESGRLDELMSTAFQPSDWQSDFFDLHPDTSALQALSPRHILIQVMNGGAIPLKQTQGTLYWDFTELDAIVQAVLDVSAPNPVPDSGPEMQIAIAPDVPGMTDSSGVVDYSAFATYAACLLAYYNKGSFQDPYSGQPIKNPYGVRRIQWWGIWSDYNVGANPLTTEEYTQIYNAAVPAMLAVDSQIEFSALEFNDFSGISGDPSQVVPAFVQGLNPGVPVGAVSLHFYSTDDPATSDADVLATVKTLAQDVALAYGALEDSPALAKVPVWITQNNVDGDAPDANGDSAFDRNRPFRDDTRGTSSFFAAWRPYLFSAAGKAGNHALVHWQYVAGQCAAQTSYCLDTSTSADTDPQNAEVDYATGDKYLSYWVDYELGQMFPSPPGEDILQSAVTDSDDVEVLAARQDGGSVVVMVVNKAVADTGDGGAGKPLTVVVDVSALVAGRSVANVSTLTLDAATPTDTGPVTESRPLGDARIPVVFPNGYGTAFLVIDSPL
jgi:hypothetical protein